MALKIIAEAVLRVEYKLDQILHFLKLDSRPMHFEGAQCPVCRKPIDYTVDIAAGVTVRRCDCKTGKVPATIPLLPVTTGTTNGNPAQSEPAEGTAEAPHRPGRKAR